MQQSSGILGSILALLKLKKKFSQQSIQSKKKQEYHERQVIEANANIERPYSLKNGDEFLRFLKELSKKFEEKTSKALMDIRGGLYIPFSFDCCYDLLDRDIKKDLIKKYDLSSSKLYGLLNKFEQYIFDLFTNEIAPPYKIPFTYVEHAFKSLRINLYEDLLENIYDDITNTFINYVIRYGRSEKPKLVEKIQKYRKLPTAEFSFLYMIVVFHYWNIYNKICENKNISTRYKKLLEFLLITATLIELSLHELIMTHKDFSSYFKQSKSVGALILLELVKIGKEVGYF